MAAHQAPLSLGFSRQEHWSRLPFPSPMHESEREVAQSCPTLHDPMGCSLPGSSVHGIFPGESTGVGCHCLLPTTARAQYLHDRQAVGRAAEAASVEEAEFSQEHPDVLLRLHSTGHHHFESLSCVSSFSIHPLAEPAQPFSRGTLA